MLKQFITGFFRRIRKLNFNRKVDSEEIFWNWFLANKSKIEKFIDSDHRDYSIYNKLTKQIKKYNDLLAPELTKTKDNKYVLIITPDGIQAGIIPTQKLGGAQPEISNWVVKKFRQPSDEITLNINGLEYPSSDIEILPEIDIENEKIDIQVFIRNMAKDEKKYQHLAFLYMDHMLGEFNTITKVGAIDFYDLEGEQKIKDSISLLQLRKLIEKELY